MSSSLEVFRRVGRGGAGNWYSQKDVDDVEKAKPEDLEAQKPSTTPAPNTTPNTSAYSRAGRGGAGNFYDPKDTDEARQQEREDSKRTSSALGAAGAGASKPRIGGRGGAGNWSDSAALTAQAEQQERTRREDLEAQILQDVDAGLAPPPAAYHHQGREVKDK